MKKNIELRNFFGTSILGLSAVILGLGGCSESSSPDGSHTSIPQVSISCTSAHCKSWAGSNPEILVNFSTFGCSPFGGGATVAASTTSISCDSISGCTGLISGWIDESGNSVSEMPAGTYSLCGIVAFNPSYPNATTGDSNAVLDNVNVGSGAVSLSNWVDQ